MAGRNRYLLTYDVRDPRRLRRVHLVARDFGYPLQYSVFVCDLDGSELISMKARLLEEMHQGIDSISVFDLGPQRGRGIGCVTHLGQRPAAPPPNGAVVW